MAKEFELAFFCPFFPFVVHELSWLLGLAYRGTDPSHPGQWAEGAEGAWELLRFAFNGQ